MRKPRLHVPGAVYHVTLRGNHRQDIFFSPADRTLFNDIVADVIRRFEARLHAYCWMTNHVHQLIQIGDTPLGRIMLRIASHYARQLQARFHTTGHVFERRYHAVLVDADAYLLELLRYIHLKIPADRRPGTGHVHSVILRITSLAQVARAFGRTESGLRGSVKLHFNYP